MAGGGVDDDGKTFRDTEGSKVDAGARGRESWRGIKMIKGKVNVLTSQTTAVANLSPPSSGCSDNVIVEDRWRTNQSSLSFTASDSVSLVFSYFRTLYGGKFISLVALEARLAEENGQTRGKTAQVTELL